MAVNPHKTIKGAWIIDYWAPNLDKPKNKKTGKHPLKRKFENYFGPYEAAVSHWSMLSQKHRQTQIIGNPKLNDIIPEFLDFVELNKSKGYYKSICWAMKKIKPFFGKYPVSHLTFELIEEFKRKHRDTPAHTNQCLRYLKIIINWAVRQKKAQPLPFKITLLPHTEKLPQPPSPTEFLLIMETVRENFKKCGTSPEYRANVEALIQLIYATGLRFNEAATLQWENLRWEDGRCLVTNTKTKVQRFCIFPQETLTLIEPYRYKDKKRTIFKRGYIFPNPNTGKPFTRLNRCLKNAAEQHGIPLRGPHDLRHAAGTDTLDATGDLRATQDLLGHADIRQTQRYTQIALKRQQRIAQLTAQFRKQEREADKQSKKKDKPENDPEKQ